MSNVISGYYGFVMLVMSCFALLSMLFKERGRLLHITVISGNPKETYHNINAVGTFSAFGILKLLQF